MAVSTIWWLVAGACVALELLTGTFILLMLSTGPIAAAIAAHLGATVTVQLVVAALFSGSAVVLWRKLRKNPTPANANHDVNLDVGETVHVESWDEEGNSTVKYRGASWNVTLAEGSTPTAGPHKIVEVVGSKLIVKKL